MRGPGPGSGPGAERRARGKTGPREAGAPAAPRGGGAETIGSRLSGAPPSPGVAPLGPGCPPSPTCPRGGAVRSSASGGSVDPRGPRPLDGPWTSKPRVARTRCSVSCLQDPLASVTGVLVRRGDVDTENEERRGQAT
ncbi:circumsporozoite protein-like [Vulpes lagopus]|uniref:circumsporozoite protein-like n=1 Tax=Vulpes lagopus TaxID=494514 RepID=UPI001BC9EC9F|nr:circumsporozoite protein-like [Vulpes lagopus]